MPRAAHQGGTTNDAGSLHAALPDGAVITALTPSRRDPSRVSVRVGRRSLGAFARRTVESLGLGVGDEVTPQLAVRLHEAAACEKAVRDAMRRLARRPLSRAALMESLRQRGHGAEATAHAAKEMERLGLLDDRAYAASLAREIVGRRPAGARLVETKLRSRGVAGSLALEIARQICAETDPLKDALLLARKRAAALGASVDARTARRRIHGLLVRRGFEPEVSREAVERALGEDDSRDL